MLLYDLIQSRYTEFLTVLPTVFLLTGLLINVRVDSYT